jgi:hypothetical protein
MDDEWDTCLNEAAFIQSGGQLRQLFVIILLDNTPADPLDLFNRYLYHLSDDCRHHLNRRFPNLNPTDDDIKDLTLQYIEILLHRIDKKLSDFSLSHPTKIIPDPRDLPRIVAEELSYDIDRLYEKYERDYPRAIIE